MRMILIKVIVAVLKVIIWVIEFIANKAFESGKKGNRL